MRWWKKQGKILENFQTIGDVTKLLRLCFFSPQEMHKRRSFLACFQCWCNIPLINGHLLFAQVSSSRKTFTVIYIGCHPNKIHYFSLTKSLVVLYFYDTNLYWASMSLLRKLHYLPFLYKKIFSLLIIFFRFMAYIFSKSILLFISRDWWKIRFIIKKNT